MKKLSTHLKRSAGYSCRRTRLRYLVLLILSLAGLMRPMQSQATTLTIGTGTSTTSYFPIYTYYTYNYSQSIYLASDLVSAGATSGTPGYINAISYYINAYSSGFGKSKDWEIYMGNTSSSAFASSFGWLPISGMTKVFGSSISPSGTGWYTITLTTPFFWDGTSNIVVAVHENTPGYDGSGTNFRYSSASNTRSIGIYGDPTDPSPASPPTSTSGYSGNPTLKGAPNVQFDYTVASPCTSSITAGTAMASATTLCPGNSVVLTLSGASSATGLSYQWDTSSTGTSGWDTVSSVLTSANFTFTPPAGRTLYYRCRMICTSTGTTATSTTVAVSVSAATPIPYTEDFEGVTPGNNVPCAAVTGSWGPGGTPYPQGWYTWSGAYSYLYSGSGSADNHTPGGSKYLVSGYYAGPPGTTGGLDYWFTPGFSLQTGKTYRFSYWYMSDGYPGYSTTGTGAFIGTAQTKAAMSAIGPFVSGAPSSYKQYVTDFSVASNGFYYIGIGINSTYYNFGFAVDDIGLQALPLCSTAPAGAITTGGKSSATPAVICSTPGTTVLGLSSTPPYSGLSFQWEMATGTPTSFSAITGATSASYTQSISTGGNYYFRCKVTCAASGTVVYSDTSTVTTVPITPPYIETFESAVVPNNMPCAGYTYSWGSPGYYWSTANAGSPGTGVVNHTPGGSKLLLAGTYVGYGAGHVEYWFTPGLALTAGKAYDISFYFRSANDYVGYDSYSYSVGIAYGNSQSATGMTTVLGDTTATPADTKTSWQRFSRGFVNATTGTKYIGIRVFHSSYMYYGTNIDDIGVVQLPPCSARPSAGKSFASPGMICSTGTTTLSLSGTTAASDLSFQWQQSTTGTGGWSNVTAGSGGTTPAYTTPTLTTGPMYYRCVVICPLAGAPNGDTSTVTKVVVGPITPPYVEDFETATVGVNQPCAATAAGYSPSWDPSGPSAYYYQWSISGAPGIYYPSVTNHTPGGSKYLSHGYYLGSYYSSSYTQNYWFSPPLALTAGYSYKCSYWYVCSGYPSEAVTYGLYYGTSQSVSAMTAMTPDISGENNTTYKKMEGAFIAPTTGVYYIGAKVNHTGYGNYGGAIDDIGVEQLPPCAAKPVAGTISATPGLICSSGTSNLSLKGSTMASLLSFQWLISTTGPAGPFVPVTTGSGGTSPSYTTGTLSATTWYRCVVICAAAGAPNRDTTPVYTMNVGAITPPYMETFESATIGVNQPCASSSAGYSPSWDPSGPSTYYYQWSISGAPGTYYPSVKNHTAGGSKYLSHGYYLGTYYSSSSSYGNNYWYSPAIKLTKDSTYEFSYWYVSSGYSSESVNLGMYYGTSQTASAMTAIRPDLVGKNNTSYEQVTGRFVAPGSGNYYFGVKVNHTGYGNYGGAIDDIGLQQLPACNGIPTAGAISVNPAMLCTPGSTTLDMDMAGVTKAGSLSYRWQWTDTDPASGFVPSGSSASLSSPTFVTGTVSATRWFRCVVKCNNTGDSTFSAIQKVDVGAVVPPYIETFESGTTNMNMPCAAYTYYGGTSVYTARTGSWFGYYYYWNVMGGPDPGYSSTPMDNHTPGGSKYLVGGYQIGYTGYGYSQEYWFTPAIKFTAGKLYQLSYWYATDGVYYGTPANYNLAVFMGSSQTAAAMTTAIGPALTNLNNTDYVQVKTLFTPTTSGNFYLGFKKGQTSFGYGLALDDIGVQEVPPCSAPVAAGTVVAAPSHVCTIGGTTSLDLTGTTLATGLTYTWQSRTASTGWSTFATGAPPVASPSLGEATWLRCIVTCSATSISDTTDETRVTVGPMELPYVQDFETTSAGGVPMCSDATVWGSYIYDGFRVWSGTYTGSYGNHTPGGKNWLVGGYYLGSPASPSEDNYWFSPGFNFRAGYKYHLSFWHVSSYSGYYNKMGVYLGSSQSVSSMTTNIVPYIKRTNTAYEQVDTMFRMTKSGVYYLGFRKAGTPLTTYSSYGVAFDDINLNYAPCDGLPFSGTITGTVTSGTSLCKGTMVTLIDTGATIPAVPGISYQWQRRGLAGASPTVWTAIPGATDTTLTADTLIGYEYRLAVVCGNTNDTAFTAAHQLPALPAHPPVAILPSGPITFCVGDTVHLTATSFPGAVYDWMLDSTVIYGWKFSDMGATEPGNYMVKVTSPLAPCPAYSAPVKLEAIDPGYKVELTVPADSILCAGSSVTLTAIGSKAGLTYQWRKDNMDIPGATGTTLVVSTSGNYRVMASDGSSTCPAASRMIIFTVKPNPPAVISVPGGTLTACAEVGVLLQANTGAYSYQWFHGSSPVFGWVDSAILVKDPGTYTVKVRSADGCLSESVPVTVNILPSPTPEIVVTGPASSPTLSTVITTYLGYVWIRTGATTDSAYTPSIVATKKGMYRVIVTDANGCTGVSLPVELTDESLGMGNVTVKGADIRIFPNPTDAKVFIQSPVSIRLEVKDAAGKTIISKTGVTEVDMSNYADGIYMFLVSDKTGKQLLKEQRVNKISAR